MGVRVEANVASAAVSKGAAGGKSKQGAGRSTDLTEGLKSDFGQELERAQPKKARAEEAAPEPARQTKPAAKAGKKAGKEKVREQGEPVEGERAERPSSEKKAETAEVEEAVGVEDEVAVEEAELPAEEEGEEAVEIAGELVLPTEEQVVPDFVVAPVPVEHQPVDEAPAVVTEAVATEPSAIEAVAEKPAAVITRPVEIESDAKAPEEPEVDTAVEGEASATPVAEMPRQVRQVEARERQEGGRQEWDGAEAVAPDQVAEGGEKEQGGAVERFAELFEAVTEREPAGEAGRAIDTMKTGLADWPVSQQQPVTSDVAMAGQVTGGVQDVKGAQAAQQQPVAAEPEVRFAEANHPKVVTAVKTELLPRGGTIQLRLDPPDLGPLRLEVKMDGGTMSASFVAASDRAAGLLTQTLGDLKHALEGAGISVDKLQVRQGGAEQFSQDAEQQKQQAGEQSSARQEQQRREMLERMWRKVAGGDPVDLMA